MKRLLLPIFCMLVLGLGCAKTDSLSATTSTPVERNTAAGESASQQEEKTETTTVTTTTPSATTEASPETTTNAAVSGAKIIFAGDLSNGKGCADHGTTDACDLYEATLDLTTGATSNVRQVTNTSQSESYPAWNPNGTIAYYSVFKDVRTKDIGYVDTTTSQTHSLLSRASWPEVEPDGKMFLYVDGATDELMIASLDSTGTQLGSATALTGVAHQEDPDFSANGNYVAFHQTGSGEAHGAVYNRTNGKTTAYDTRSGHCAFGGSSLLTLCDNVQGGGIFARTFSNDALSASKTFVSDLSPSAITKYDPEMATCQGTSFNYPTFCGDDTHLLVSTSCSQGGSVTFSRLFLIDVSGAQPVYYPIGKQLAEQFSGTGKSTWTVDCLPQ